MNYDTSSHKITSSSENSNRRNRSQLLPFQMSKLTDRTTIGLAIIATF